MTRLDWPAYSAVAGTMLVGLVCLVELVMPRAHAPVRLINVPHATARASQPAVAVSPVPAAPVAVAAAPVAPAPAEPAPVATAAAAPVPSPAATAEDGYYASLRASVRWVQLRFGNQPMATPDYDSRLLLAKSAAQRAGLADVGLSFRDVYGIINAETSWVPRMGASKDGTPNLGIAQFEPATARALGLRNPNDLVEAVHVAARHMKEAALWSADRIAGLKLGAVERAIKLREGVSIYYNLSSKGRAAWNGRNTHRLPVETQRHIANARVGADEAAVLDAQLQSAKFSRAAGQATITASAGPNGG